MNELYHVHGFKYVKREWKNGKWNYYYDNGKGKSTSLGLVNKISDWIGEDEKERYRQHQDRYHNVVRTSNAVHEQALKAGRAANKASNSANKASSHYLDKRFAEFEAASDHRRAASPSGWEPQRKHVPESTTRQTEKDWITARHQAASARNASRQARTKAEELIKTTDDLFNWYDRKELSVKNAPMFVEYFKQAYDSTLLGKAEKGLNWIKNLFK